MHLLLTTYHLLLTTYYLEAALVPGDARRVTASITYGYSLYYIRLHLEAALVPGDALTTYYLLLTTYYLLLTTLRPPLYQGMHDALQPLLHTVTP